MPGYLLDMSATLMCAHGGKAQASVPNPRVKLGGQASVTQTASYLVTGCGLTGTPNPPCASAQWVVSALRIKSGGQAVLLQDSKSQCVPTGTPLNILVTQMRVKGT